MVTSQIDKLRILCPNKAAGFQCTFSTVLKRRHADIEQHIYECCIEQYESRMRMRALYEKELSDREENEVVERGVYEAKLSDARCEIESLKMELECCRRFPLAR